MYKVTEDTLIPKSRACVGNINMMLTLFVGLNTYIFIIQVAILLSMMISSRAVNILQPAYHWVFMLHCGRMMDG